jgi:U1 small nuclear ribonucleoprotein C
MPKYFCEYCGIYLTHSSPGGRKQHSHGRKHINNKIEYYSQFLYEFQQNNYNNAMTGALPINQGVNLGMNLNIPQQMIQPGIPMQIPMQIRPIIPLNNLIPQQILNIPPQQQNLQSLQF